VVIRRPPAPPKPIDPVSILVADFVNMTGDAVFDGALEQPLTIAMEGASFITSYGRSNALKLAQTLSNATRLDAAAARPVAFREGIKYVLAGSVAAAAGTFQLQVDAIDPVTGKTMRSATATAASKGDVLGAVGTIAAKIRTGLGDTTSESAKLAAGETFTAGSIDAMREYSAAQDLQNASRNDEALTHYRRAIELDPKFGRAYAGAANISFRLGQQVEAEAFFKQALSLMDRMTDREKHRTLGSYYLQSVFNFQKAVDEYSALVRAYPSDSGGHANLAMAYFGLSDFARAMEEGRRAVETDPKNITARYNLALFQMYAGDFANAASYGKDVVAENRSSVKARLPIAVDAIIKGDLAAANAAYDDMATAGANGASLAAIGRADVALFVGRAEGVTADLKRSIAADLEAKSTTPAAVKQTIVAEAELAAGRRAPAIDAAHQALQIARQPATMVPAARVLLRAGTAAEARTLAADLGGQLQTQSRAYGKILLAEIALEEKRPAEAVDLLTQSRALADLWLGRFDLGVAYVQAGAFAEAISELEACEKRRGEATALFFDDRPTLRYLAPLAYWIGRAQEGLNMAGPARAHYDTFLSLRKDATADPLVQDARRRISIP
jgi:tetratricopeptide (TPR) repeat protein